MARLAIATVLLFVAACRPDCLPTLSTVSGPYAPTGQLCQGQLLFNENFDSLNTDLWQHDVRFGGPNGEFQWYTDSPRNTYTTNGILFLKPTLTTDVIPDLNVCNINLDNCSEPAGSWQCQRVCNPNNIAPPVQSSLVKTINKFNFKYGRVVVRAKLPSGKWLWPAIWFLPSFNKYGNWPLSGEIDLMESRGNDHLVDQNNVNYGAEQFGTTLHFGTHWYNDRMIQTSVNTEPGQGFDADFHEYGMEWSPDHIQLTLDGQVRGTFPTGEGFYKKGGFNDDNPWANAGLDAPFDQEFYFILNNAVGATNGYFVDGLDNKPWQNGAGNQWVDFWNGRNDWLPTWNMDDNAQRTAALQVDYVRLYAL